MQRRLPISPLNGAVPRNPEYRKVEVHVRITKQSRTRAHCERLQMGFAERHAAAVKHTVVTTEKTIGRIKRYLQVTTVMAAKQSARAQ